MKEIKNTDQKVPNKIVRNEETKSPIKILKLQYENFSKILFLFDRNHVKSVFNCDF